MKRSKIKEAHLTMTPYRSSVWIWLCSPEEAVKALKKTVFYTKYGADLVFIPGGGRCITLDNLEYESLIWIDSSVPISHRAINLSHEFVHVVGQVLTTRGVKYDPDNDEPFAYMMTSLMEQAKKEGFY